MRAEMQVIGAIGIFDGPDLALKAYELALDFCDLLRGHRRSAFWLFLSCIGHLRE
jgi:hypothetical protein